MATQLKTGEFTGTLPLDEALEFFKEATNLGLARSFHVGTPEEIESQKEEANFSKRIKTLEDGLAEIKLENETSIEIPTAEQIKRFMKDEA